MWSSAQTEASKPKYRQIAADLTDRIQDGEYAPGAPLPSLAQLGAHYDVSQITIRQAVRLLVEQGLIKTVPRKGMFAETRGRVETGLLEHRVGVLLPSLQCWSALYPALCAELHDLGHDILMKPLPVNLQFEAEPERALFELEALRSTCGGGLIMFGDRLLVETFLHERRDGEVVVCLENSNGIPPSVPVVTTDNFGGTFAATRYLLRLGHRRVAYLDAVVVQGPETGRMLPGATHEQRFAGYRAAMKNAGLALCMPEDVLEAMLAGSDAEQLARLFRRPGMPTALVCFNDSRARSVCAQLAAAGICVPEEVSVTGYDNDADTVGGNRLTSLDQNAPEIARQLVRMLHGERDRLASGRSGPTPQILVPPILHIRDSVASPPA